MELIQTLIALVEQVDQPDRNVFGEHLNNLFNLAMKPNATETNHFRSIVSEDTEKDQRAFGIVKHGLLLARLRNAERKSSGNKKTAVKRAVINTDARTAQPNPDHSDVPPQGSTASVSPALDSVETYKNKVQKKIDAMPKEDQTAALTVHVDWLWYAQELSRQLSQVSVLYEKQKRKCAGYELLLGIRAEIEHQLMDTLYPKTFPTTKSQFYKCLLVLTMQEGRMVDTYRTIVKEANFTNREFCYLADTEIYDPKSVIVHSTDIPDYCLTLENYLAIIKEDVRLTAFIQEGHRRKDLINTILKLRKARLTQTGELGTSDSPDNSNRCILMSNVKLSGNRGIPNAQIKSAFKATAAKDGLQSICETRESYVKHLNIGDVLINFIKPVHAASAILEHLDTIRGQKVHLLLVDCMDVECSENIWSP